jgi:ribosomal protein S18 acetylase RimI-like enzyme
MTGSLEISLRRAEPGDCDFAFQVLERTMRGYVEETWGVWSEATARVRTSADAVSGRSRIIYLGSESIGLLCVDHLATHLQLEQLYLLPTCQRRGIGAQVLQLVLSESHALGLPVRLRVLRVNPAKRFYERHGFRVTSETPERLFMERAPTRLVEGKSG